jgi:hypothetical protein
LRTFNDPRKNSFTCVASVGAFDRVRFVGRSVGQSRVSPRRAEREREREREERPSAVDGGAGVEDGD